MIHVKQHKLLLFQELFQEENENINIYFSVASTKSGKSDGHSISTGPFTYVLVYFSTR